MRFRLISALLVFLGSYFPLALILALQDISSSSWEADICFDLRNCSLPRFDHPWLAIIGVSVSGICLLLTCQVVSKLRFRYPVTVIESKPIPSELISYSFPYIVSFMGVDYSSPGKIAGLVAFLIWLFLITYKAGQIIMNPMLIMFGWNLYEAKIRLNSHKRNVNSHERNVKILSKKTLIPGNYLCELVHENYITDGEKRCD